MYAKSVCFSSFAPKELTSTFFSTSVTVTVIRVFTSRKTYFSFFFPLELLCNSILPMICLISGTCIVPLPHCRARCTRIHRIIHSLDISAALKAIKNMFHLSLKPNPFPLLPLNICLRVHCGFRK